MSKTSITGPYIVSGNSSTEPNGTAPSLFAWGSGFYDSRYEYQGSSASTPVGYGFPQQNSTATINAYVYPQASIASAQATTADLPMTLASVSVPGLTVGLNVTEASTGVLIPDVIMMDDFHLHEKYGEVVATTYLKYDNIAYWDPSTLLARRIYFIGSGIDNEFLVDGIDCYGYRMQEYVYHPSGGVSVTLKAFKGIISITPAFTDVVDIEVSNQSDTGAIGCGLPVRCDNVPEVIGYAGLDAYPPSAFTESCQYFVQGITPALGILTIDIAPSSPGLNQEYTLPVGSVITISGCNPVSYNGSYIVLTSAPGEVTVASDVADVYVSDGLIFCDESGLNTADTRGVISLATDAPFQLVVYQTMKFSNMSSSVGQFGIPQYGVDL